MDFTLTEQEARVLGCLIEKDITTPEYYPLTLNSLVNACNQKSNRDPVVYYDDAAAAKAILGLRDKKLAVVVNEAGSRVPKYKHACGNAFALDQKELALMCELMLRGAQTAGELRGRASRLSPFSSIEEAEQTLQALMSKEGGPLVTQLARQPGRKEPRYAHLLCGEPQQEKLEWAAPVEKAVAAAQQERDTLSRHEAQIQALQEEIAFLKGQFAEFKKQFE